MTQASDVSGTDLNPAGSRRADPSCTSSHSADLSPDTIVVAAGRPERGHDAPVNPPIVLSSTYVGMGQVVDGDRAYGRYSNPTWDPFEEALATLEGATLPGLIYGSGLAAVSSALSLIPAGGVLVMPRHSYQGALVMAAELAAKGLFTLRTVDIADTEASIAALQGDGGTDGGTGGVAGSESSESAGAGTPADRDPVTGFAGAGNSAAAASMLWLESPTNPMLEVADLRALSAAARAVGAVVVTDNTFSTPLVQKPLELGSDVVLHSVTKYLAGHSDVVLGALVTSNPGLREALLHHRSIHGAIAGPFEAWLALRGLRTLALRVERSQATAAELAVRLLAHPRVDAVRFPGLSQDPGHERAKAQMCGFGSVLAIEVHGGAEAAEAVVQALALWTPATSLGGVESLIERRRRHINEPASVPNNLLRLSVGIENIEDLWSDLAQALDRL